MLGLWRLFLGDAQAHPGIAPILEVSDYSQLPDAPPGAWIDWGLHPSTIAGTAAMAAFYFYAMGPLRERWGLTEQATSGQKWRMVAAMLVIVGCLNGPLHHVADNYLFSVHMIQHLLLTLVMPMLFIRAWPEWFFTALFNRSPNLLSFAKLVTLPVPAFLLYNGILGLWHIPAFYNHTMESHPVHIAEHLMFMVTAVICWWPVVGTAKELQSLQHFGKIVYLVLLGVPMKALGAIITMANDVLYTWYAHVPRMWGIDPLYDQRIGGIIMWVPAGFIVWGSIGVIFVRWYREEAGSRSTPANRQRPVPRPLG